MKIQIESVYDSGYEKLLSKYPVLEEFSAIKVKSKDWDGRILDVVYIEIKTLEELNALAIKIDKPIIFQPEDAPDEKALYRTTEPYLEIYDDYRE